MTPNSQLHDDGELSNFTEVYIQSSANRQGVLGENGLGAVSEYQAIIWTDGDLIH